MEREQVVEDDEDDGENEAGGFASSFGGEAERHADEHEDEAGKGVGEALVELDAVGAGSRVLGGGGVGGIAVVDAGAEFAEREREDVGVGAGDVGVVLGSGLHGEIGGAEGLHVVLVGVGGGDLVLGRRL